MCLKNHIYPFSLSRFPVNPFTNPRRLIPKKHLRWVENEYGAKYSAKSIKVPKSPKRPVRIYSADEVKQIFDGIGSGSDWLTVRNKCIVALMYDSGLRQGDKERTVPLGRLTQKYIRQYVSLCPYQSDFLFVTRRGSPLTCNAVKLMVSKLSDRLPFELSSHKLRHNFVTNYCLDQYDRHGQIDIYRLMYLMGHEEIDTTKRYLHFAYEIIASSGSISHLDNVFDV